MSHTIQHHIQDLHTRSTAHLSALKRNTANYTDGSSSLYESAKSKNEEPQIPAPGLFNTLLGENIPAGQDATSLSQGDIPSVGECAVHLELLEVFAALRARIIASTELDTLFGVKERPRTIYRKKYDSTKRKWVHNPYRMKDTTLSARKREKWLFFLHLAVGRFIYWARTVDAAILTSGDTVIPHLPPCDILMVWHALLLNPGDYREYCKRDSLGLLQKAPFPWERLHSAIDTTTLSYTLPPKSHLWTEGHAHLTPDLYEFLTNPDQTAGAIARGLAEYGKKPLKAREAWTRRPSLTPRNPEDHSALQRGLVDTYEEASRQYARAKLLVANVQRQASFVDKMHRHLWIRSPAVQGTISRAIARYEEFLHLFSQYPGQVLVPTLDVDLVWHTHQLSAERYATGVKERAGRFINHDDKIVQGQLDDGYERTKALFQVSFGRAYAVCLCWDCEAIASAIEKADEEGDLMAADEEEMAGRVKEDVEYHRVVELVRREKGGTLLPVRKGKQ